LGASVFTGLPREPRQEAYTVRGPQSQAMPFVLGWRATERMHGQTNVRPENTVLQKRVELCTDKRTYDQKAPYFKNEFLGAAHRLAQTLLSTDMCDSPDQVPHPAQGEDKEERPRTQSLRCHGPSPTSQARAKTLAIPRSKPRKLRKGGTRSEGRKANFGKTPTVIHTGLEKRRPFRKWNFEVT